MGRTSVVIAVATAIGVALGAVALWAFARRAEDRDAVGAGSALRAQVRGVLDDAIVLGMVSSFTGSNKERGRAMRLGWEMAIADANEAGGVHGRRLRLVAEDDGYDPARTLAGMKQVIDEQGAFAIVGNVGTSTAAVAIPYAAEKEAVFFGALSGGDLLRKTPPDRHVFNFRASLAREGQAAVRYLVDLRRLDPRRIAVLAQDDEFGASGRRGAVQQLTAYGLAPGDVLQLSYPRNTADVRDAVAKLQARARDFDAVVMVATYKPAATFVRKSKDAGLNLFYTTVSADSNGLAEELVESGPQYTQNVLLTQVVPVPTSQASTLIRYRESLERHAPGEKPGSTSLEAWIGAQIFLEGLRRAGRDLSTPALIAALESISDWDIGIGGKIGFGPASHQGCDAVWGWLLQPDGTYRQVDLE
jgi:ABC-type branched-subunit amino acid transport system substrate-binding protein